MLRLLVLFFLSTFAALPLNAGAQNYRGMEVGVDVTDDDLRELFSWGANFVRYPLSSGIAADFQTESEWDEWFENALLRLDQVIAVSAEHNAKVAILLYSPPGGFASHRSPALHRVFAEQWARDRFVEAWRSIAARYANSSAVYGYDLLNEPAQRSVAPGLQTWRELALATSAAIRESDTTHPILIEPVYGDISHVNLLKNLPIENYMISPHMYYPLNFLHQGLYGKKRGVVYPTKTFTKKKLLHRVKRVVDFQRSNRVPVYLGEFTVPRWAPGKSGATYLRDVIDIFEKYNWDWTYHSFREAGADVWSVEHGSNPRDHNRSARLTDRAKVLRKYFKRNR